MGDKKERPDTWENRKKMIHPPWKTLKTLFGGAEWVCEWIAFGLSRWALIDVLNYASSFTILSSIVFFFIAAHSRHVEEKKEADNRAKELKRQTEQQTKAKHYQAWQMLNFAAGKDGDAGRHMALADLYGDGVSFKRINLVKAVLTGIRLDTNGPVDFQNATMNSCQLDDAHLQRANFRAANLTHVALTNANCDGANFEKADLTHANLFHSHLEGANFKRATLIDANLTHAEMTDADLSKADLAEVSFDDAVLRRAKFSEVENWKKIKSMAKADISEIRDAPDGFKKWAKDHGAIDKP